MKRLTLIILALAAICSFTGTDAAAQAKFTTRKEKLSDLMYKTTKVVLTGNELLDESFKEEVIRRWRITPYEFCTFDDSPGPVPQGNRTGPRHDDPDQRRIGPETGLPPE